MKKRILTEIEEKTIRLVHHDFDCLSRKEAAAELGVSRQRVDAILRQVKRKAPSLFPILTRTQKMVADLLDDGFSYRDIIIRLNYSVNKVAKIVQQLHKKGYNFRFSKGYISYKPYMDSQIKEKF